MREILFRGKGKYNNKEWIYGNLIKTKNDKFWITNNSYSNGGWLVLRKRIEVDPKTVGQFTGLLDKNGKKIFEGDIVTFYEVLGQQGIMVPFKGVVKYGNGYYYVEYIDERNRKGKWNLSSCWHLVVVGNIHDNNELYKKIKGDIK